MLALFRGKADNVPSNLQLRYQRQKYMIVQCTYTRLITCDDHVDADSSLRRHRIRRSTIPARETMRNARGYEFLKDTHGIYPWHTRDTAQRQMARSLKISQRNYHHLSTLALRRRRSAAYSYVSRDRQRIFLSWRGTMDPFVSAANHALENLDQRTTFVSSWRIVAS